jgi:hypothetical protein
VLDVQRFDLVNPYLAARGKGKVDYRAVTGDLTLVARLLKTPEGNVAGLDLSHLTDVEIPVTVRGPLADPKVRPTSAACSNRLQSSSFARKATRWKRSSRTRSRTRSRTCLGQ